MTKEEALALIEKIQTELVGLNRIDEVIKMELKKVVV